MHRPKVASVTRFFSASVVCGIVAILVVVRAGNLRGEDDPAKAPSHSTTDLKAPATTDSKPNKANTAASGSDSNEHIAELVKRLGDDLFAVREKASNELVQNGVARSLN